MPSRGNGGEKGGPKSPGRCLQGRGPHAAGTEGSRARVGCETVAPGRRHGPRRRLALPAVKVTRA